MTGAISWAMLEHSSPNLTNKVYTNVDPVFRHAVDQIGFGEPIDVLADTQASTAHDMLFFVNCGHSRRGTTNK